MATRTSRFHTWLERIFGQQREAVIRFTPTSIQVGDEFADSENVRWQVDARERCPFARVENVPAAYREHLEGTWIHLWRISAHDQFVLHYWMPEQVLIDLLSRGE